MADCLYKYQGYIISSNHNCCLKIIKPYNNGWREIDCLDYNEDDDSLILQAQQAKLIIDNLNKIEHLNDESKH